MNVIPVALDKISHELYPELFNYLATENSYRAEPLSVVMAVEDDIVRGAIIYSAGEVSYLYVPEESRLSGVGSYLVNYVRSLTADRKLSTRVEQSNSNGLCFFLRKGWRIENQLLGADNKRYFRMTNTATQPTTPSVEAGIAKFVKTVPVFISVGKKMY